MKSKVQTFNQIVAVDKNFNIGYQNKIPWHCKEDLQLFKKKTLDGVVVMGKNTLKSIGLKPLPNRVNVVISQTLYDNPSDLPDGFIVYSNVTDFIKDCRLNRYGNRKVWFIGGNRLWYETRGICTQIHVHQINTIAEHADTQYDKRILSEHHLTYFQKFANPDSLLSAEKIYKSLPK